MKRLWLATILLGISVLGVFWFHSVAGRTQPPRAAGEVRGASAQRQADPERPANPPDPSGSAPAAKAPGRPAAQPDGRAEGPPAPPARNPLARPEPLPAALAQALSDELKADPQRQLEALSALGRDERNRETAAALRWVLNEPGVSEVLRNEAAKVLLRWRQGRIREDFIRMLNDPAQAENWRAYCAQYLEEHYRQHNDQESLSALHEAAQRPEDRIRDQAIYSLARLAQEEHWEKDAVKNYASLKAQLQTALASERPSTVVTALRAIALLETRAFSGTVEGLAGAEGRPLPVRVAAVQALGAVGGPESEALLRRCAESGHTVLAQAAKSSLGQLKAKP